MNYFKAKKQYTSGIVGTFEFFFLRRVKPRLINVSKFCQFVIPKSLMGIVGNSHEFKFRFLKLVPLIAISYF